MTKKIDDRKIIISYSKNNKNDKDSLKEELTKLLMNTFLKKGETFTELIIFMLIILTIIIFTLLKYYYEI